MEQTFRANQPDTKNPVAVKQITPQLHASGGADSMCWYNLQFPDLKGRNHFQCFQLAENICFTKSTYQSDVPLLSEIDYPTETTLLVFGLMGESRLGFCKDALNTIKAGEIWLFNVKGSALYRYTSANTCHEMAVLKIPTDRLQRTFSEQDRSLNPIFTMEYAKVAIQQDNARWIAPLLNNPLLHPFDRMKAEGRALALIAHWLIPLAQPFHPDNAPISKRDPIERARKILISEMTNPPTLDDLARKVGMSHTRLNRSFKKTYGKTVFSWLRSYRIALAKSYLRDHAHSITEIAHLCGFSSASHFTQAFRQQEGLTPIDYRSQH
ncbi:AraC family transcriptional regulator [Photobacterium atrarenae]|uniref:AraC family transcriptional regulator n=1 Tax=Photobacterium atrarenae TaxID=865757 RepID=A0ABY5GIT6_9GAMM|nr:AraC family transcriptional regulator [Photobacterium atrarenae]UTV29117.1 AraC family transcriptional regulator [Photobacterium atrarenae]